MQLATQGPPRRRRLALLAGSASCLLACGDDDRRPPAPPRIEWSVDAQEVTEGGALTVRLLRLDDADEALVVRYATADGTAAAGADYTAAQGELRWERGDRGERTVRLSTTADLALEGAEALTLELEDVSSGAAGRLDEVLSFTIADANLLGDAFALTSAHRLVSFDRAAPDKLTHAVALTGLTREDSHRPFIGLDVRPRDGSLVAINQHAHIYAIDPASGRATRLAEVTSGLLPFPGERFAVDFDPGSDRLTVASDAGLPPRSIDVDTGEATPSSLQPARATSLAYDHNVRTTCRAGLFSIDEDTDRLMAHRLDEDPPELVGPLGLDLTSADLDVETTDAGEPRAFALARLAASGDRPQLLRLDLATGAAARVGELALPPGETATGFALRLANAARDVAQAPGRLQAVTSDHRLITLEPESLRPCTSAPITGLGAYQILALDLQPATGELYAFARHGAASAVLRLSPGGAVEHLVPINYQSGATSWAANFDPVSSELRLVNNEGQNLRVTDVETGAFVEETPLSGASTRAFAASYSDSLRGAGAATLYTIDPQARRIMTLDAPADGRQTEYKQLASDVERVTGFEIDGRDHQAILAYEPPASYETRITSLDLRNRRGPTVRSIWPNQRLRGLTLAPPAPSIFALLADQQLVELSLSAPIVSRSLGAISGLAPGEQLLALTAQRAPRRLVGVSDRGALYAVDPATARATRLAALTADPNDGTAPFERLSGGPIGLTFSTISSELLITDQRPDGGVATLRVADLTTGRVVTEPLGVGSRHTSFDLMGLAIPAAGDADPRRVAFDRACRCLVQVTAEGLVSELTLTGSFTANEEVNLDVAPSGAVFGLRTSRVTVDRRLLRLDRATGTLMELGSLATRGLSLHVALAMASGDLGFAAGSSGDLYSFAPTAPDQATLVGGDALPPGERVSALDFHPGTGELWMLTREASAHTERLYTVSVVDGSRTLRATLAAAPADPSNPFNGLATDRQDMSFEPTGALLIADGPRLLRLPDPATGLVITESPPRYIPARFAAAAFLRRVDFVQRPIVVYLDVADRFLHSRAGSDFTGPLGSFRLPLGQTGDLSDLASLAVAGGTDGLALAAVQRRGLAEPFSRLHRVDLTTGRLTDLGPIGAGPATRSLAILLSD